jgi:hypothetical protein
MRFISVSVAVTLAAAAAAEFVCQNPTVVDQVTAGQNGEVTVKYLECANQDELRSVKDNIRIAGRQAAPANVCGNTCTLFYFWGNTVYALSSFCTGNTNCFSGAAGTGPNPNDCQIIADALLYDSQNVSPLFTTNPAVSQFRQGCTDVMLTLYRHRTTRRS